MMKQLLTLLLAFFVMTPQLAARSFEYEGLWYTVLDEEAKTCETRAGSSNSAGNDIASGYSCQIPSIVSDGNSDYTVIAIGDYAFYGSNRLSYITIPNSIAKIGEYAFYGSSLSNVLIPPSVMEVGKSAFEECRNRSKSAYPEHLSDPFYNYDVAVAIAYPDDAIIEDGVVYSNDKSVLYYVPNNIPETFGIPNSVIEIGDYAMRGCPFISGIIPDSVKKIGEQAFEFCYALTSVTLPNSVTEIGDHAFRDCSSLVSVKIPESVTIIREGVFSGCQMLTSVIIPNSVTKIGDYAFMTCRALLSVVIPNSVTEIGLNAFSGCSSLESVTIPNSVVRIDNFAFYGCSSLTSVAIPSSVREFGERVFEKCRGMIKSAYPEHLSNPFESGIAIKCPGDAVIDEDGSIYSKDRSSLFYVPVNATGVFEIPNGVISIGSESFGGCSELASVIIPNSVTGIGAEAFKNCNGLIKSAYPEHLSNPFESGIVIAYPTDAIIESGVIYSHNGNTLYFVPVDARDSFEIPDGVTFVRSRAFSSCCDLTSIIIPNSVTEIGAKAFDNCAGLIKSAYPEHLPNPFESGIAIAYPTGSIIDNGFIYNDYADTLFFVPLTVAGNFEFPHPYFTSIGSYAFAECDQLTNILFGDYMTSIGCDAFVGCAPMPDCVIKNNCASPNWEDLPEGTKIYTIPEAYSDICKQWRSRHEIITNLSYEISDAKSTSYVIRWSVNNNLGIDSDSYRITGIRYPGSSDKCELVENNPILITGLGISTEYDSVYVAIEDRNGKQCEICYDIYYSRPRLELQTLAARGASDVCAIICAETNMDEEETGGGFEWRRYDAPELVPSTFVACPVDNGRLESRLKDLSPGRYYKYRPYYEDAAGERTYGEWSAFGTSDTYVYIAPVVRTDTPTDVTSTSAELHGYVLAGSDDILEQGFEYCALTQPRTVAAEGERIIVDGQRMRVLLDNLLPGTSYSVRSFITTTKGNVYGDEMVFTTVDDPQSVIDSVTTETIERFSDIYTLQGVLVCRNASADAIQSLSPGLYIVGGRKILVR